MVTVDYYHLPSACDLGALRHQAADTRHGQVRVYQRRLRAAGGWVVRGRVRGDDSPVHHADAGGERRVGAAGEDG